MLLLVHPGPIKLTAKCWLSATTPTSFKFKIFSLNDKCWLNETPMMIPRSTTLRGGLSTIIRHLFQQWLCSQRVEFWLLRVVICEGIKCSSSWCNPQRLLNLLGWMTSRQTARMVIWLMSCLTVFFMNDCINSDKLTGLLPDLMLVWFSESLHF